ncbi:HAD-IIA family hydrolase [Dinoroseobacter sp. S76]|uniref:HAD-IIA family hydrolase n=1 Tax=Dinoroseobacter sp. S76 TaxID=3415124 RepID=UPI003C7E4498
MMTMTAEAALDAYEAARHRLPKLGETRGRAEKAACLVDLADRFDVFLLDAFGVLNVGETVIPGAPESVAALQAMGKRVLVVSNAASVGKEILLTKYHALGFAFAPEDVVTSRETLSARMGGKADRLWGIVAPDGADLSDLGLTQWEPLRDDPDPYARCEGVILIGTGSWSEPRQALLDKAFRDGPRPVLVANPDIVAPRETGFSVEPGLLAHRLADLTGAAPEFYGKPFANIFELAFARLEDVDPSRVLMVGDSLHTDILGAQAFGISAALIPGFGFFAGGGAEAAIARTGIAPDFIVERP